MTMPEQNSTSDAKIKLARQYLEMGCDSYENGSIEKALSEFLTAGRLGNREAQLNLGNMFSSGELGTADIKKAIYHYKKSIRQGSPEASAALAITYRMLGKRRGYLHWMRHAARLGDEDAIEEMRSNADTELDIV
jgi:TPR repeat protein